MREFRRRLYELIRCYPRLARGGLNQRELLDLARRVARRSGLSVRVAFKPWPWPASVVRIARTLVIIVDEDRIPAEQVLALAHEVGHIALGHYHAERFWADTDGLACSVEEQEADLFASLVLSRHLGPLDYLGREQFELFRQQAVT